MWIRCSQIILCDLEFFGKRAEGIALLDDVNERGCGWDDGVDDDDGVRCGGACGRAGKVRLKRAV